MTLEDAVAVLERRRAWLEARGDSGRSLLGDRAEIAALDVVLPLLREQVELELLFSLRVST